MMCAYCHGPIPAGSRRDAKTCGKRCRQALSRFRRAVGVAERTAEPLRLAYADPPYPGKSRRYYGDHPDFAGEVDHRVLLEQLQQYDGWALSTSAEALQDVLALCPRGVRVAAWTRGARHTVSAGPLNAWEPVIYYGGRQDVSRAAATDMSRGSAGDTSTNPSRSAGDDMSRAAVVDASRAPGDDLSPAELSRMATRDISRRVDALVHGVTARTTDPAHVTGAKPAAFANWLFADLLGARAGDHFTDLFPGSGGITRAWHLFTSS